MLKDFIQTALLLITGLFPVINPIGSAFIVLSMVPHTTEAERTDLSWRITTNSFAILLGSLLMGAYVLTFFGISIPVLRVAGGLIIAVAGWNLLQKPDDDDAALEKAQEVKAPKPGASLASKTFYPLTLPLMVGPGSISVAIALGTSSPKEGLSAAHFAGVAAALVVLSASIYICMRFAGTLERWLGSAGTKIVMRLFALITFCIGMQLLWLGLKELLESIKWQA
ncbi:MarC family protein [Dyella sp. C11]|uniref:MarC family protein n=1 Tax=Dyella sp. C11 TaxID=2126991 RepID=UPI000D65CD49|nr:MarC family protein [Dyella sp. C11]